LVKGRKRHILVDTLGLLLVVVVTTAAIQDRDGARILLNQRRVLARNCERFGLTGVIAVSYWNG
jgi:hypothetical protein